MLSLAGVNDAGAAYACDHQKNTSFTFPFMENRSYFRELT